MILAEKYKKIISRDWCVALILLIIFLLTHGYMFGWDDQHAEIPLLKSLIDDSLYPRDYFVQSLRENFPSHFYSSLARVIRIDQIPIAYFVLYVISRYFLFFWIYKFWLLISKEKKIAFFCTLTLIVLVRVQFFLYRTLSHAEFAFAFVFAGLYFFYKERFILAAAILGLVANFHAIYGLYPMIYLSVYLLIKYKKHRLSTFFKASLTFLIFCTPLLIITMGRKGGFWSGVFYGAQDHVQWLQVCKNTMPERLFFANVLSRLPLSKVLSNFVLFILAVEAYLYHTANYTFNCLHNKAFRSETKNHVIILTSFFLLSLTFCANYIWPNKFIIALDFVRTRHFVLFLLPGYMTFLFLKTINDQKPWVGFIMGILLVGIASKGIVGAIFGVMAIFFLFFVKATRLESKNKTQKIAQFVYLTCFLLAFFSYVALIRQSKTNLLDNAVFIVEISVLLLALLILQFNLLKKSRVINNQLFIILPIIILIAAYMHALYIDKFVPKRNYMALHRDWEDTQRHAKELTPKDALILVPYDMDMGGFQTFSERSVLCSLRDIGGFLVYDFQNVFEWRKRLKNVEPFKMFPKTDLRPAIVNAIRHYDVDHIVFMTRIAPTPSSTFELLYSNKSFALYRINKLP